MLGRMESRCNATETLRRLVKSGLLSASNVKAVLFTQLQAPGVPCARRALRRPRSGFQEARRQCSRPMETLQNQPVSQLTLSVLPSYGPGHPNDHLGSAPFGSQLATWCALAVGSGTTTLLERSTPAGYPPLAEGRADSYGITWVQPPRQAGEVVGSPGRLRCRQRRSKSFGPWQRLRCSAWGRGAKPLLRLPLPGGASLAGILCAMRGPSL